MVAVAASRSSSSNKSSQSSGSHAVAASAGYGLRNHSSSSHQANGMDGMTPGVTGNEDLVSGLSLSSPIKPSRSNTTRASSSDLQDSAMNGIGSGGLGLPMFVESTGADMDDMEDDDDDEGGNGRKSNKKGQPNPGRRKIEIEYIEDKSKRHITFSKRKAGIMKKAYELSTLTGTQVLLLVVSETGLVYTYTTTKLQPLVTAKEGKALIQACLTADEGEPPFGDKLNNPSVPAVRSRSDHRKVSMQVRMANGNGNNQHVEPINANSNNGMSFPTSPLPHRQDPPLSAPPFTSQTMQQQQNLMPSQLMQSPYMSSMALQQQTMQGSSMLPSGPIGFNAQNAGSSLPPMPLANIPAMPVPSHMSSESSTSSRTLKKRKTVDNLRTGKETAEQAEARRAEAAQLAQEYLEQARQNPTLSNLLRAYQQQDVATRSKPSKLMADTGVADGLDSTIQLFQMSCEDSATGPEADHARLRGERWTDHVGVMHLSDAIDNFIYDFLVNKCIRTAKDVKGSAKDLQNFSDWLFAHSFAGPDLHQQLVKRCTSGTKAVKKKESDQSLNPSALSQMPMTPITANGMVRPTSNPAARAEQAGKTLIEYCEFARSHYEGVGQEQGVTALNGYFLIDRVRSSYVMLRGIPIEGDPHSNSEAGPFKVRMPPVLTANLRARDQFLLSLNRYSHINYWLPTACGDVHPTTDEDLPEDPLNPQYHHMEAEKAQRNNDQLAFGYHYTEYQFSTKAMQLLEEGELPEDGFGGVSVQQVLHSQPSQTDLHSQQDIRPVRRQPSRAANGTGWINPQQF